MKGMYGSHVLFFIRNSRVIYYFKELCINLEEIDDENSY